MPQPIILSSRDIESLPLEPLGNLEGVVHRVLWRDATSMAGILTIEAGRSLGSHSHRRNHHHIWVLEGTPVILGQKLGPGAYVHVPSGVEHDIEAPPDMPSTVLYMYLAPGA